ncbi:MAG: CusA/CzcA family heavy metal efflux RND transporter [Tunicatimonas sp.]
MLARIIRFSIHHKLIVLLFTGATVAFGVYALTQIPIGAVPDVTNNQVQVITTSRNLSTQDVEQFITYPVELEMANLPGVKEIRSVSKFGLSVVTIVFEESEGTYLPRQLIAEKIKSASEKIPEGFGSPFMGPITTGLGEVYQYILDTKPGYDSTYSAMDLRTLQDWVVKRQLSGIRGVVEVNTWGGYLKQYEVAINPERLRAMNVTVLEVYDALEKNNSVAGGAYIEKGNEAYFVRGEGLVQSISDIENIVVAQAGNVPVLVKDIAQVHYGYATRFGAITGNGEGEKVLGQVMMLKGANSQQVLEDVKARVAEIQTNLPEGVYINPFLERSELVAKTTYTVAENLILGCLIVILVVVLLLGNLRFGLVIASVIPLCLLFAISLMYIFGVDANLMSLGAIDFGIIIDGAVIIVEYVAFRITSRRAELAPLTKDHRQTLVDNITQEGSTKMMRAAVFGQLIIILVFIPILSLEGVEGKMFRPMALTFCFALIGAMIFCFTYVPVAASLLLKPARPNEKNISVRLMSRIRKTYTPVIHWALGHPKTVLASAAGILAATVLLFTRMGGEFIPTLDEGDFVIQPVLKTGTSLSKTIETTTRIEQILLDSFPEVSQVVTRIGAAEVPTDPMSMEETDVIVKLKPKDAWVSANTKDELAERFTRALSIIPGVEYEFTQPIEMRFNELITGVRADVAIKIFGEDLDVLTQKAQEVKQLISGVPGATDITVEKVAGLPQMSVKYDRTKLARYGVNVDELNRLISLELAGLTAGSIFEGEKRFDLAIRLQQDFRQDIGNLQNLYVDLPGGGRVPLRELATVAYTQGPAKISRDDTQRRIVVGVNIRDRDMESVVEDVQSLIRQNVRLPTGYTIAYGGQFENLRSARDRLQVAVPIALLLIFMLLYFAFNSVREALMVYSAIPLAAVGGVLLLWLRGLPFSISAGVGFIALFGIAVLNGLVLIEHFKHLKEQGVANVAERIVRGTTERLRPVLLTASAAALGFFPMAISTSAGAEVQRPLATVVIGGLVTATLLTLVVLPVLYAMFDAKPTPETKKSASTTKVAGALLPLLLIAPGIVSAQERPVDIDQVIRIALANNRGLQSEALQVAQRERQIGTAWDIDKTSLYYSNDQNNIAENGFPIRVWGVQQTLRFPTVYGAQRRVRQAAYHLQQTRRSVSQQRLVGQVAQTYYRIVYWQHRQRVFRYLDSLYGEFARAAERRYALGETNYLEKITAEARQDQLQVSLRQTTEETYGAYQELMGMLQIDSSVVVAEATLRPLPPSLADTAAYRGMDYYQQATQTAEATSRLAQHQWWPDIQLEYFEGTNRFDAAELYRGVQIGLSVPLWFGATRAHVQAADLAHDIALRNAEDYRYYARAQSRKLQSQIDKFRQAVDYYRSTGERLASELFKTAQRSFQEGEIDFLQYVQTLDNATSIELEYLDNLSAYNQTLLEREYLILPPSLP